MEPFESEPDRSRIWYVYALAHPDYGLFYVGKGKGARINAHELEASDPQTSSEKANILSDLAARKEQPSRFLVDSGLSEDEAYNLESILIEFCRKLKARGLKPDLRNIASGHGASGFMLEGAGIDLLNAPHAELGEHTLLLISIKTTYDASTKYRDELPDHVAGRWALSKSRALDCEYVLACWQGLIVGVYQATQWHAAGLADDKSQRFRFEGQPATGEYAQSIIHKRLPEGVGFGLGNPVLYYPRR